MATKKEQNWLDLKPSIKAGISTEFNEEGFAAIVIPRFNKAWMAKMFLPKNKKNEIRLQLDKHGTSVWTLINGENTVGDIINTLSNAAQEEQQFEQRIILFLQNLYRNGFIVVTD